VTRAQTMAPPARSTTPPLAKRPRAPRLPQPLPLLRFDDEPIVVPPPTDPSPHRANWDALAAEWSRLAAEWEAHAGAWAAMGTEWAADADPRAKQVGERARWAAQRARDLAAWIRGAAKELKDLT